ncbi:MAG: hypothetical protein AAFX52_03155 [Pseudomonadota bacterium]
MPEFAAQLIETAGATFSGMRLGVLAIGVLAAFGFAAYIFRDDVPLFKSKDRPFNMPASQPPRLSDPTDRMDRARERFWDEGKGRALTTAFQGLAVVAVVFGALAVFNGLKPEATDVANAETEGQATETSEPVSIPDSLKNIEPYCEFAGSIDDDFLEFCANRSAVRMDFVRLRVADRFAVEPVWVERTCGDKEDTASCVGKNDGSLISSVDHPAPFVVGSVDGTEAPLTSSLREYDGYFVVGAMTDDLDNKIADNRRRTLSLFAELQMCGAEGKGCDRAKGRVFSSTASFDAPICPVNEEGQPIEVDPLAYPERTAKYCNRSLRLQKDQRARKRAADEQLGPELIIIGLKIDDLSPTPVADMAMAARCFMNRYSGQGDLGFTFSSAKGGNGLKLVSNLDESKEFTGSLNCNWPEDALQPNG